MASLKDLTEKVRSLFAQQANTRVNSIGQSRPNIPQGQPINIQKFTQSVAQQSKPVINKVVNARIPITTFAPTPLQIFKPVAPQVTPKQIIQKIGDASVPLTGGKGLQKLSRGDFQGYKNDLINGATPEAKRSGEIFRKIAKGQGKSLSPDDKKFFYDNQNKNTTEMVMGSVGPGVGKNFTKQQLQTVRNGFTPEVRNLVGKFAEIVEKNQNAGRREIGPLGEYVQGLAESVFGKQVATLNNKQLLNLLDVAQEEAFKLRANPKLSIGLSAGDLRGGKLNKDTVHQLTQKVPLPIKQQMGKATQVIDNVSNEANVLSDQVQATGKIMPQQLQKSLLGNLQLNTPLPETISRQNLSPRELGGVESQSQRMMQNQQGQSSLRGQSDPFENIIAEAKKEISDGKSKIDRRTIREVGEDIYTNWVDRFHPITKLAGQVEKSVGQIGAELRPEVNPRYTIKRFLGAGGIAENRFNNEFKPILEEIDNLKIDKSDLDVYLKNRRDVGFGEVGREIKGSDPVRAQNVVGAIEAKYGDGIKQVADKLYSYQNKMFDELTQAGFIDPDNAKLIRTQNPDYVPFFRDMESQIDNYLGLPSNKLQQAKNPLSKIEGSDKKVLSPVESIIANTFKYRAAIEKNNVAKSIAGLQRAMPELGFKKVSQSGTDTISVWENGQKSFYQVGDDIAETVKGLNEEQMNSVLKVLSIPSTWLRQGATGRNPDFILPNMVRDQLDAALNSKYGYVPFVDWARGLAHMYKKDEIYQRFQQSGAQIKLSDLAGRKGVQELFTEKTNKKIVPKLINFVTESLDKMGSLSEQPTRVGLFAKGYKKTGNELLANMESREGTLDFARMGSKMKVANSLIPFLNVGIQGFDKMARTAKANPAKFALKMGIYGATPTLATTLYNVTTHPEEYKEIPQWVKNSNFVIVTGRNENGTVDYISIPKGNVVQYISNPIENFVSYLADTDSQTVKEMTLQFLSSGAPVIGDGSSFSEIGLKTIGGNLPQAIKPSAENLMNKSFFKFDPKKGESKAIVPTYLQNKADGDQSYEFTPSAYKTIGKALNISPLKVQNFLEGHFAGGAKIPVSLYETAKAIVDGDPYDKNKTPILRRFIQQTYPTSESKSSNGSGIKRELAKAEETSMLAGAEASGFKNPFKKKEQPKPTGSEKITEVSWESDAGRKTTVKLNAETKKQTGIDAFNKENPDLENARKIYKAPSDQVSSKDKEAIYKQLGFTKEQLDYDHKASGTFNTDERVAYIQSKSPNHDKLIANLTTGREMSIAGNRFATDAVIDQLYKNNLLSSAERKQLKALTPEKKSGKITGGGKKRTKLSLPKPVKGATVKLTKSSVPKMQTFKTKKPPTIKFAAKTKPQKFKVKGFRNSLTGSSKVLYS